MKLLSRVIVGAAAVAATVLATAPAASAHTAVALDNTDVLPWTAPLILNGENPVALFGTLNHAGSVRSAQLRMQAGQHVVVSLAIPDQAPENTLSVAQLPKLFVVTPTFGVSQVPVDKRIPITTEDGQHLLILGSYSTTAVKGDYSVIALRGSAPARFVASTGIEGEPFAGIARGRVATDEEFDAWYSTPPSAAGTPAALRVA